MSDLIVGLLDTNVFIHAQTNDISSQECREFLRAVERGTVRVEIPPVVLHELTYALPRYLRQLSRADVATYLLSVLHWPGIRGDNELMIDAVKRWARTPGLAFVDIGQSAGSKKAQQQMTRISYRPVDVRRRARTHRCAKVEADTPSARA